MIIPVMRELIGKIVGTVEESCEESRVAESVGTIMTSAVSIMGVSIKQLPDGVRPVRPIDLNFRQSEPRRSVVVVRLQRLFGQLVPAYLVKVAVEAAVLPACPVIMMAVLLQQTRTGAAALNVRLSCARVHDGTTPDCARRCHGNHDFACYVYNAPCSHNIYVRQPCSYTRDPTDKNFSTTTALSPN
jgi:hypothetical protein